MIANMQQFRRELLKEIKLAAYDTTVFHINNLHCTDFIVYDSEPKASGTSIVCNHLSANYMTEIKYTSLEDTTLATGYARLQQLLTSFKSYSQQEIQQEEALIKSMYMVTVTKAASTKEAILSGNAYTGLVEISP